MTEFKAAPCTRRTTTTACPTCGQPAVVTLLTQPDYERGTEGNEIDFACSNLCPRPSAPMLLRLWARSRK